MTREKRLGRGLEALLGRIPPANETAHTDEPKRNVDQLMQHGGHPRPDGPHFRPETTPASAGQSTSAEEGPYGDRTEEPYGVPLAPSSAFPRTTIASSATPELRARVGVGATQSRDAAQGDSPRRVAILRIDSNPYQPRQDFDDAETQSLAESIAAHGLLQPIVVRRHGERFQLVAGERRLRAATKAGWTDVPVQVVEADDRQLAELAIIENLQRKDLNPLEKAKSFQRYLGQYRCTQEELAARLKLDRSTIANLIRLLELPAIVQDSIRKGKITQGHARALLPLGDEQEQVAFCQRIQRDGLSVRQTENLVQEAIRQADGDPLEPSGDQADAAVSKRPQDKHIAALEQQFRAALGTRVAIRHTKSGRGRLVVYFRNHEEFDRLRQQICDHRPPAAKTRAG